MQDRELKPYFILGHDVSPLINMTDSYRTHTFFFIYLLVVLEVSWNIMLPENTVDVSLSAVLTAVSDWVRANVSDIWMS